VLKDDGSFIFNIKENVNGGERSDYVHETVKKIREQGFKWNDTYIWEKMNPYPIKPIGRFKDAYENIFHFTKSVAPGFKFFPDAVKVPGKTSCAAYDKEDNLGNRQSKVNRYRNFSPKFLESCKSGMVYPSNVLPIAVNSGNTGHPATFPEKLPGFFIDLLSKPGDVVLDPFAGSGTTNIVAKKKGRETMGMDINAGYVAMANERLKSA
jgi:DNA modification methylase